MVLSLWDEAIFSFVGLGIIYYVLLIPGLIILVKLVAAISKSNSIRNKSKTVFFLNLVYMLIFLPLYLVSILPFWIVYGKMKKNLGEASKLAEKNFVGYYWREEPKTDLSLAALVADSEIYQMTVNEQKIKTTLEKSTLFSNLLYLSVKGFLDLEIKENVLSFKRKKGERLPSDVEKKFEHDTISQHLVNWIYSNGTAGYDELNAFWKGEVYGKMDKLSREGDVSVMPSNLFDRYKVFNVLFIAISFIGFIINFLLFFLIFFIYIITGMLGLHELLPNNPGTLVPLLVCYVTAVILGQGLYGIFFYLNRNKKGLDITNMKPEDLIFVQVQGYKNYIRDFSALPKSFDLSHFMTYGEIGCWTIALNLVPEHVLKEIEAKDIELI
jgi:hypothetical protein